MNQDVSELQFTHEIIYKTTVSYTMNWENDSDKRDSWSIFESDEENNISSVFIVKLH